jgi:hypothetical protein
VVSTKAGVGHHSVRQYQAKMVQATVNCKSDLRTIVLWWDPKGGNEGSYEYKKGKCNIVQT